MVRGLNAANDDELQWLGEFAKGVFSVSQFGGRRVADDLVCHRLPSALHLVALVQVPRVWERDGAKRPGGCKCRCEVPRSGSTIRYVSNRLMLCSVLMLAVLARTYLCRAFLPHDAFRS